MNVTVNVFDPRSMQLATNEIANYLADLGIKANTICERLASIGAVSASFGFRNAIYNGVNDTEISVEPIDGGYAIHARGNAVLFIEFGSGATYGYGHPDPQGYGPGTYPGKGHWNDPRGWWFPQDSIDAQTGSDRYVHSYGNPPAAAMYEAQQDVIRRIQEVADEVFAE